VGKLVPVRVRPSAPYKNPERSGNPQEKPASGNGLRVFSLVEENDSDTINKALAHLEHLDIVHELTAQKRNRLFSYSEYTEIMSRGTELPER
jgi:hypothetical protein